MSISSSSFSSIMLKSSAASTISFGEISKGYLCEVYYRTAAFEFPITLFFIFFSFFKAGNQSSLLSTIKSERKSTRFHRICHSFIWNFLQRFDCPLVDPHVCILKTFRNAPRWLGSKSKFDFYIVLSNTNFTWVFEGDKNKDGGWIGWDQSAASSLPWIRSCYAARTDGPFVVCHSAIA